MPNISGYDYDGWLIWFAYTVERQNEAAAAIFVLRLLCEAQTGVNIIRETRWEESSVHFLFDWDTLSLSEAFAILVHLH